MKDERMGQRRRDHRSQAFKELEIGLDLVKKDGSRGGKVGEMQAPTHRPSQTGGRGMALDIQSVCLC